MKAFWARPVLASALFLIIIGVGTQQWPSTAGLPGDNAAIVHVLNRIGFGPRPGDVERVRQIGLQQYIDQQLHPERIPDSGMGARLQRLTTIRLSSREIAIQYAIPALEARRERKQTAKDSAPQDATAGTGFADTADSRPVMPDPAQQRANLLVLEIGEQKILRAVYSDRQLEEVLTDFWFNHFNVDARKGPDRFLLTEYEREAIRPHVLGHFRDLLEATAKSPAMLFYLDNWQSADPAGPRLAVRDLRRPGVARGPLGRRRLGLPQPAAPRAGNAQQKTPRGLNENYGRELMELHTLGVDGGYTQKDVTEVARSFTGWTIRNPRLGGGFRFEPRLHDDGQKMVLGHVIKAGGGIEDGEQVIDILASHPSTARFVATKLARRFVSDSPPPALVDRAAARFRETGGDLREVTRTILTSPEFLAPEAIGAKVKTPFEFVASALRSAGADVRDARSLVRAVQQLGMPLYQCQPPTGYKDTADAWINTGALVGRMNFAVDLAGNKLPGVFVSTVAKLEPPLTALTLGSPEFQKR